MLVIHCPACAAGLRLPRAVLAKRARRICCAVCEHRWIEAPVVETAQDAPIELAEPEISLLAESGKVEAEQAPIPAPPIPARKRLKSLAGRLRLSPRALARLVSGLVPRTAPRKLATCAVLALVLLSVMKRDAIVRVAPPLAGAYAAIGLPVNLNGLQWRDVKTRVLVESSQRVLAVEGEIRNLRDHSRPVPDIQLSLRDDDGREVYRWSTPAPKANLDQNETIQFRARLASPPDTARAVRVHFAEVEPAPENR
jgi:hypothetical protein